MVYLQDKVYLDNLEASVSILKKLSVQRREQHVNQSSIETVKQTVKSFQQKVASFIFTRPFYFSSLLGAVD